MQIIFFIGTPVLILFIIVLACLPGIVLNFLSETMFFWVNAFIVLATLVIGICYSGGKNRNKISSKVGVISTIIYLPLMVFGSELSDLDRLNYISFFNPYKFTKLDYRVLYVFLFVSIIYILFFLLSELVSKINNKKADIVSTVFSFAPIIVLIMMICSIGTAMRGFNDYYLKEMKNTLSISNAVSVDADIYLSTDIGHNMIFPGLLPFSITNGKFVKGEKVQVSKYNYNTNKKFVMVYSGKKAGYIERDKLVNKLKNEW